MSTAEERWLVALLNRLPFVTWDRGATTAGLVSVFGWIARADGRADFVVIQVERSGGGAVVGFVTSSAKYAEELAAVVYGSSEIHAPCRRVADMLPGVERVVR